ncbi:hypothetical protein ABZ348_07505 [Streptomyces sp. NPDC005963]|uniref:TRAFAC clade GTPase domain-containing protein n=1 Tax=Streptomyces sp. NPDC005963 TaxID=3156721 RepID=UPI0033C00771
MPAIPVTVLGPHQSGKTVYLASLFHRLALQRSDTGFFIRLPQDQSKRLNEVYGEIISPDSWPDPTILADVSEWNFTCAIRTATNEVFSPFTINYMDFAGEHLTNSALTSEAGQRVWKRIDDSEFLLILLDGAKVKRCFEGDYTLIQELLPVFNRLEHSSAVMHFVITKWDLVEAAGHSVNQVLEQLLRHPHFQTIYENRMAANDTKGALRIIPVSALGAGFALPDGDNMVKQGGFPRPTHVEVPLMAVLIDLFEQNVRRLAAEDRAGRKAVEVEQHTRKLSWVRALQGGLPRVKVLLGAASVNQPTMRLLQQEFLGPFMDFVSRKVDDYGQQVERDVSALRNQVLHARSEQDALTGLVALFEARLAEFEASHPGSHPGSGGE